MKVKFANGPDLRRAISDWVLIIQDLLGFALRRLVIGPKISATFSTNQI